MTRKKISSADLIWVVHERLQQFDDHPRNGISIAIVPETENKRQWKVVTSRSVKMKRPLWARRIQSIETRLRKEFVLTAD
jgi:hypothetical protein